MRLPEPTAALLTDLARNGGSVVVLTGAGISAESGIPTFRGPDGYWTVGSRHYRAEELATAQAFSRLPREVWGWYLYRHAVCAAATPNPAHEALAELERRWTERFTLITQNIDGLHLRAGNTPARTFQIHGSLDLVRCASECGAPKGPVPEPLRRWTKHRELTDDEAALLRCAGCGGFVRPHVLWFDEYYDEANYHFDSSLRTGREADALIVVGTSGATNLPNQLCEQAFRRGAPLVVINADPSPFSAMAEASDHGAFLQVSATEGVRAVVDALLEAP